MKEKDKTNQNQSNGLDKKEEKEQATILPQCQLKKPWWKKIWLLVKSFFHSDTSDVPSIFRYLGGFLFLISQMVRLLSATTDLVSRIIRLGETGNYFIISGIHLAFLIYTLWTTGGVDVVNGLLGNIREIFSTLEILLNGK